MDEILMLTNHADDLHAVKFAHQFARQNGKVLVLAQLNRFESVSLPDHKPVTSYGSWQEKGENIYQDVAPTSNGEQFHPPLKTIDASRFNENMLATHICQNGYAMVICKPGINRLNLQTVVDLINCPLMLLPDSFSITDVKRIVYLTDLRYCQQQVINYLDKFKRSSVLLAHICEKGLPDLIPSYGNQLFTDTIRYHVANPELFFSHIKESGVEKMVDILVNTMSTDMMVCLNRRFHFQQLLGEQLPKRLPAYITVPLLVFPC